MPWTLCSLIDLSRHYQLLYIPDNDNIPYILLGSYKSWAQRSVSYSCNMLYVVLLPNGSWFSIFPQDLSTAVAFFCVVRHPSCSPFTLVTSGHNNNYIHILCCAFLCLLTPYNLVWISYCISVEIHKILHIIADILELLHRSEKVACCMLCVIPILHGITLHRLLCIFWISWFVM